MSMIGKLWIFIIIIIVDISESYSIKISRNNNPLRHGNRYQRIYSVLEDLRNDVSSKKSSKKSLNNNNNNNINNRKDRETVETGHVYVQEIPSLSNIKSKLRNDENKQSEKYCLLSGGYPNSNVKESVYVNLLLYLNNRLEVEVMRDERRRLKKEVLEDLKTFGLL